MKNTIENILNQTKIMVIDGSMSTPLEKMGCDLNDKLWTARILAEKPELIEKVHYDYLEAGADCGITASYQASVKGLTEAGCSYEQACEIIINSVSVFLSARERWWKEEGESSGRAWPLCLGSCGPYGAYLADGSEYRGRYGVSDETLREFHQERARLLWEAGADVLLFETMPSFHEVMICAEIAEEMDADYWISFCCKNETSTWEGDDAEECACILSAGHPHLKMIGANCTMPANISGIIRSLKKGTDLPVAVYPNSGEVWDAEEKVWRGSKDGRSFGEYALLWMREGASAVGGCCTTVASHIRQVKEARDIFLVQGMAKYIR